MSVVAAESTREPAALRGLVAAGRRQFLHVLLACLGLHLAWAFAMPVTSGPDEPAHVYRAVSIWQGDLVPTAGREPDGSWIVRLPSSVPAYAEATSCFKWKPEVTAGCARTVQPSGTATTVGTGAGRYFPLYYYGVGWPGRLDASVTGFYAMRVVSLVVSATLLALAVVTVLRTTGRRWAALVLPIAITPQVLWLGSIVNPNAWEVDAAILAWAAGLALVCGFSPERQQTLWARFLLGGAVLVLMRRLSPLWLVLIVVGVLVFRRCLPAEQRSTLRSMASRPAALVLTLLGALCVLSVWWHLTFDLASLNGGVIIHPAPAGLAASLAVVAPSALWWLAQTYGVFGSLDTASPVFALFTWLGLGGVVFAVVVLGSRHRRRIATAVALGILLWLVIPLAFSVTVGRQAGIYFWQGRYTMPFSQGIPLALGMLGASWRGQVPELERLVGRLSTVAVWVMWPVLATLCLVWALHRYAKGDGGDWSLTDLAWSPPGGVAVLVTLHALAAVGLVTAVRGFPRRDEGRADDPERRAGAPRVAGASSEAVGAS